MRLSSDAAPSNSAPSTPGVMLTFMAVAAPDSFATFIIITIFSPVFAGSGEATNEAVMLEAFSISICEFVNWLATTAPLFASVPDARELNVIEPVPTAEYVHVKCTAEPPAIFCEPGSGPVSLIAEPMLPARFIVAALTLTDSD